MLELMSVILNLADIRSSYLVHAPLLLGITLSTVACLILYEVLFLLLFQFIMCFSFATSIFFHIFGCHVLIICQEKKKKKKDHIARFKSGIHRF